jgi:CBS domain-containing protein
LDPSCIGKKGAKAEAKARAKAQKQAEAEAKAKAKADARAKARADAEAKARAKKETKANARAQAKPYRGAPPEDIERIRAETEWAKVEIENAKAQAQTAIAEAQEAKAEVQKARAEAEKLRTDHVQIATTEKHAVPVSAQTTHATDTDAFLSLCAKDIMQKDVLWASPEESVQQALGKMRQYRAAYVMVGRDNMPAGIVSKSDLMAAVSPYLRPVFAKWRRPLDDATLNIKIKWAMTKRVRTIPPEVPLIAILENMRRFRKRCLPVMDRNGKVQGLVTVFDIFQALLPDGQPKHLYHAQSAQSVTL